MNILYYYVPTYFTYSWWLVTVTYLQHHDHDTLVYDMMTGSLWTPHLKQLNVNLVS